MDNPIDLERLSEVFTDHPWLAEAISNGAWWGNGDGTVQLVTPVEDPMAVRAGLVAFAEALGVAPEDVSGGGAPARSAGRGTQAPINAAGARRAARAASRDGHGPWVATRLPRSG